MVEITDSLTIQTHYRPAWAFARSATSWLERASEARSPPNHFGSENCFLAFMFSCLCLEAIIAEFLVDESAQNNNDLLHTRISLLQRWQDGVKRLGTGSAASVAAITVIDDLCKDKRPYGLLVRSRNKLIHPLAYTEVIDDSRHTILDGSIDNLVADLKAANLGLPESQPAFPHIIKCRPGAIWATNMMKEMIQLLHAVCDKPVEKMWSDVLDRI